MTELFEHLMLLIVAVISNGLSAMAGGGAGLLQLPALIFLGLPFSVALATHKIASVALGLGASVKHAQERQVGLKLSALMLVFGLPGVILGAHTIVNIPANIAQLLLGVLTIGLGVYSIVKKKLGQTHAPKHQDSRGLLIGGLGLFLWGVLNGSLTSGTGLFVTIWLINWFGFDYKRATAYTLVLVGIFWNGAGAITFATLAPVQWAWLPALILGSLIGGYTGAWYAAKKGNVFIKRIFEVVTILVGLSLIIKSLI